MRNSEIIIKDKFTLAVLGDIWAHQLLKYNKKVLDELKENRDRKRKIENGDE